MNKIMVIMAVAIAAFFINKGFMLSSRMMDVRQQKNNIMFENAALSQELEQKQRFKESKPKAIADAFAFFINETKMFETYSGTRMKIVFTGTKENEDIEDHYVETNFRDVKGLPLTINVEKFSDETDMVEVLNDIYLLESRTDFKVSEISTENSVLIVKGELYGI